MKARLRELTLEDIELTHKWHNDEKLSDLILSYPPPISLENEKIWLAKVVDKQFQHRIVRGIETQPEGNLIGIVQLHEIDTVKRQAFLGLFIGESEFQSKGYGGFALKMMLQHAFNVLHLSTVFLEVAEGNSNATQFYMKNGFEILPETLIKVRRGKEVLVRIMKLKKADTN